ncbi:MAG: hypothetical protein IKZ44_00380 [Clostridia bacterium]|nr:hypothetical protein [Clostridia bacterium]
MKKHIFVILFTALLLLCACQPTPENPIVVGKDNEAMIEKAKETGAPDTPNGNDLYEALGCPEVYTVSLSDEAKKVTIEGNAKVVLPDTDGLPLLYVGADRFSQETVYAFFNRLCGDEQMVEFPTQEPKYAIQAQMDALIKEIDELHGKGLTDDDIDVAWRLRDLESLQRRFADAPETVELTQSDGTLKSVEMTFGGKHRGTVETLSVLSRPFTDEGKRFGAQNDASYDDDGSYSYVDENGNTQGFNPQSGSTLWYERTFGSTPRGMAILDVTAESISGGAAAFPEPVTLRGWDEPETVLLSVSPKDAREQAEAIMRDCGITDMRIDSVALWTNRRMISEQWEDVQEARARCTPERQAYIVRFLRCIDGVPVEGYFGSSQVQIDGVDEGPEWSYETLTVAVDDGGILSVNWTGPLKVEETVTDRAALLPFSEISAIFQKMLPIKYTNINSEVTYVIRLDRVRLCLWRILDRDSYTRGILAPVWCFYGWVNSDGYDLTRNDQPLLIINAIDGSVIDPMQGY